MTDTAGVSTNALQRWGYLAVKPMNLFIRRAWTIPVRAEDFDQFSPDQFMGAIAAGLDAAGAEYGKHIGQSSTHALEAALSAMISNAHAARGHFERARSEAPTRGGDMFILAKHFVDIASAMSGDPVSGAVESVMATIERAAESRQRLKQTREYSALYAADLLDLAELWLQKLTYDVFVHLNADFQRARLA